LIFYS